MTRTRVAVVAVGLILMLAALAAFLFRFGSGREGNSRALPVLSLQVNGAESVEIAAGTPLIFDLTLRGERHGSVAVGNSWRPWYSLLRLTQEDGRALPWPASGYGEPRVISLNLDGPDPKLSTTPSDVARLVWQTSEHTVSFAVAPEHTQQLRGTTRIRAVLASPWWMPGAWHGRVTSPSVAISVPADAATRRDLNLQRLAASSEYFLARREYELAQGASQQLIALAPDRVVPHMLHGDALAGLGRREEALAAYQRAVALSRPSYEEPTLLLNRIARVLGAPR